jgi:hypothetical protein
MAMTSRVQLIILFGFCLLTGPVCAQNLVINPEFIGNLDGWTPFNAFDVTATWSPLDQANSAKSGSLLGTLPAQGTFRNPPYASQCIALSPNRDYDFGARVLLPEASTPTSSRAYVAIEVLAAMDCGGSATAVAYSPQVMTTGAWAATAAQFNSGPTGFSAQVLLYVSAPSNTLLQSHFDDVFVMQPELLFREGFEN